ncbi:MAG: hypothetical protein OXT09_32600 [Myxococcales bacterium]|nr:hypothetical protein [Myxococcales bacterium]
MSEDATQDERTEAVAVLIRRGAYRDAVEVAAELLGGELGRFCMALLGDQGAALAALEEVLTGFYEAMPSLEDQPLRPFLYGRALAVCERVLEARGEAAHGEALSLTPPGTRRLPQDAAQAQRDAREIRVALAGLKPNERTAALLRYTAALDYAPLSQLCGTDTATAKKRIGKALLAVRKRAQEGASE